MTREKKRKGRMGNWREERKKDCVSQLVLSRSLAVVEERGKEKFRYRRKEFLKVSVVCLCCKDGSGIICHFGECNNSISQFFESDLPSPPCNYLTHNTILCWRCGRRGIVAKVEALSFEMKTGKVACRILILFADEQKEELSWKHYQHFD